MKALTLWQPWASLVAQPDLPAGELRCTFCGVGTDEYGTAVCANCGERKCVAACIPGGNKTMCLECEENEDDEVPNE